MAHSRFLACNYCTCLQLIQTYSQKKKQGRDKEDLQNVDIERESVRKN